MEWIKCSDRMPTNTNQGYLVVIKNHPNDTNPSVSGEYFLSEDYEDNEHGEVEHNGFCWCYEDYCNNTCTVGENDASEVTHWMPYPEPPTN